MAHRSVSAEREAERWLTDQFPRRERPERRLRREVVVVAAWRARVCSWDKEKGGGGISCLRGRK
jgi:hypothetical protein